MAQEILRIDFRDVGQGDCTVITLPDQRIVMIDVGPAASPVAAWISGPPVRDVAAIVLTHNDEDHAGALPSIVETVTKQATPANLWLLRDRDAKGAEKRKMQTIFARAAVAEEAGLLKSWYLDCQHKIWEGEDHSIEVLFPSALGTVLESPNPNQSSAIISLTKSDGSRIIWPGDNYLRQVSKRTSGRPFLLHGPHHGAPGDVKHKNFGSLVSTLSPEMSFLSVGSKNGHNHPNPNYVRYLARAGSCVSCSGLNKQCDKNFDRRNTGDHVLDGTALLGFGRSGSTISCRGSMTVWSYPDRFESDEWHDIHLERKADLGRPKCL